MESCRINQPR